MKLEPRDNPSTISELISERSLKPAVLVVSVSSQLSGTALPTAPFDHRTLVGKFVELSVVFSASR